MEAPGRARALGSTRSGKVRLGFYSIENTDDNYIPIFLGPLNFTIAGGLLCAKLL